MNTGYKKYNILEQYNLDTGQLTGITKPNSPLDPDYIAPVYDIIACPIGTSTTTTTTTSTTTTSTTSTTTTTTTTQLLEPSIIQISNTRVGLERIQVFQVGLDVPVGAVYNLTVYSHTVSVTAVLGDDVETITQKLVDAINATTEAQWNSAGTAPSSGTVGFPPLAIKLSYNQIEITLNYQNSFAANAY